MSTENPSKDYRDDPAARRREWFRYYSEKRIGHQWFQVHLLQDLDISRVLEIGPGLGLVTAMLDNAGYDVTTLDFLPSQYDRPHIGHIEADLAAVDAGRLAGFDAILCCETLEHFLWEEVDELLDKFRTAKPAYLLFSVPYMGFQLDWRVYLNASTWKQRFSLKTSRAGRDFRFDAAADPLGHKWEAGYRGRSLKALEDKVRRCGWRIARRDFTSPTRSVFYLLQPA